MDTKSNWISADDMRYALSGTPPNPYYEKPKRGRPTKAQKEKKKLYYEWETENNPTFLDLIFKNKADLKVCYKHREENRLD